MDFLFAAKDSNSYTWIFWVVVLAITAITKFVEYKKKQVAEAAQRAELAEKYKNRRNVNVPSLGKAHVPQQAKLPKAPVDKPAWEQEQEFAYAEPLPAHPEFVVTTIETPEIQLDDAEKKALEAIQKGSISLERTAAKRVVTYEQSTLLTALRNPSALRAAIIYREILSEPIALRKARSM